MSTSWKRRRKAAWIWVIVILVAGIAGGMFAWPHVMNRYHRWSAQRLVRQASALLAKGDPTRALLTAKTAIEHHPTDAEATRLMAKSLEALGAPMADEWRGRLDSLLPGDAENLLARAGTALKAGGPGLAEQFINELSPAGRNGAAFHDVAGAIAMAKRDTATAVEHWAEAARLEPAEDRHRLNLAAAQLESRTLSVRAAGLAALQELRGKPATSLEAWRLLLADGVRTRDENAAMTAADALVADARANFKDKLARLSALRLFGDDCSGPYLLELRDAALAVPADLFALLDWMNSHALAMMVAEWVPELPQEIVAKPPMCIAAAEAHLQLSDWEKLEKAANASAWGEFEYLRRAMLARALEHTGEEGESDIEWKNAVASAGSRGDHLETLAKFAMGAKWNRRAEDIMWALTALPRCPRWVVKSLWVSTYQRADTAQLQKLSATAIKIDPTDMSSRINFALLAMLTRSSEGNPHATAENLYREHPKDPVVASLYGFSLFRQGKPEAAVKVMSTFKAEELQQPQVALYCAIFYIAAGQPEKAEQFLKLTANAPFLPEEKSLLRRVQTPKDEDEKKIPAASGKQ